MKTSAKIIKELLYCLLIFLGVSVLTFTLGRLAPGDAVDNYLKATDTIVTDVEREAARKYLGLDQPVSVQFFRWLFNAVRGDFGISYSTGRPVLQEILFWIARNPSADGLHAGGHAAPFRSQRLALRCSLRKVRRSLCPLSQHACYGAADVLHRAFHHADPGRAAQMVSDRFRNGLPALCNADADALRSDERGHDPLFPHAVSGSA